MSLPVATLRKPTKTDQAIAAYFEPDAVTARAQANEADRAALRAQLDELQALGAEPGATLAEPTARVAGVSLTRLASRP